MEQLNILTFIKYTWPIWAWWGWIIRGYLKSEAEEAARLKKEEERFRKESNLHHYFKQREEVKRIERERQSRKVREESEECAGDQPAIYTGSSASEREEAE